MGAYLRPWQLIPLSAFVLISIIVGAAILKRFLVRQFEIFDAQAQTTVPGPRRSRRLSTIKCVLALLLAGMGGGFAGAAIFALFRSIEGTTHETIVWLLVLGGVLSLIAMLGVAYLILLTMFPLPAGRVFRAAVPTFAFVLVLGAIFGTPTALVARQQRMFDLHQEITLLRNLRGIDDALRNYEVLHNEAAPSLEHLVEQEYLMPAMVKSPANPDRAIGYFYIPRRSAGTGTETQEIRASDLRENFEGRGRGVLFTNGARMWVSEGEFQQLLNLEVNSDFAEALREYEGG